MNKYGGLFPLLAKLYPQFKVEIEAIMQAPKAMRIKGSKAQKLLLRAIARTLNVDRMEILSNYKHPALFYFKSSVAMELDLFLPRFNLAFEYQVMHI
jgi:hypothetical protein